ncbi:hypothetical protein FDA94_33200 [Herbidospora galbida]|uniref:Uncharacterized protein n=1 Tax=Herbidospora galbida TaxID=2575442 RepID=A0A4V5UZN7_9ACTN|nr:hypothetical protein [Herbidospora galbida]TKK83603.1 hypothetical protein FDA94_33200 [Herbidospora galbida]
MNLMRLQERHDVTVGREGEIFTGDAPPDQPLSRVQGAGEAWHAASHMPRNTVFVERAGAPGWMYSFQTSRGRAYTLFAYFDGSDYQVSVLAPELGGITGAPVFPGVASLEEAYAKSVIWAAGMDAVLAGRPSPC